jgi:UDP-N-acetylglucosamine--N-acetylmuramyl-(pentapeptide) pyrophosphoryl-undecaprenol N-acetylglucosamine transferase
MRAPELRPIVIAAGGTGGHFFPAEALSAELAARGRRVVLMTDARTAGREGGAFEQRLIISGAGIAGRGALRAATALISIVRGVFEARAALSRLRACAVVGFGGYPAVAPVLAARLLGIPAILHEQNAVLGRANRFLARHARALALSFAETTHVPRGALTVLTGNPVRPGFAPAPYTPPDGGMHILVLGGSLGARALSDVVPAAIEGLAGPRPQVTQQCRPEDLDRVRAAYAKAGIEAELAAFFPDIPRRLAEAQLVIARAGASTVAEIAAVGRPAILIPLPHAIDDHQAANARALGARVMPEPVSPRQLRRAIEVMLPDMQAIAAAIGAHGRPDAAARLAVLVETFVAEEMPA